MTTPSTGPTAGLRYLLLVDISGYTAFLAGALRSATDDKCLACVSVQHLDLKAILHRGLAVAQRVGGTEDLQGPAVNAAHRLLKNSVRDRIGYRPYLFVTAPAAAGLGLEGRGFEHEEAYADVGRIEGRVLDLAELARVAPAVPPMTATTTEPWPDLSIVG